MKLSDIPDMVDSVFCIVPTDTVEFPEQFYLASENGIKNLFNDAILLLHIEDKKLKSTWQKLKKISTWSTRYSRRLVS